MRPRASGCGSWGRSANSGSGPWFTPEKLPAGPLFARGVHFVAWFPGDRRRQLAVGTGRPAGSPAGRLGQRGWQRPPAPVCVPCLLVLEHLRWGCYFRPHYFILLLPAVAIFGGAAGSWMVNVARWPVTDAELRWGWRRPLLWPAVGLLLAATAVVVSAAAILFRVDAGTACRHQYKWEPSWSRPQLPIT